MPSIVVIGRSRTALTGNTQDRTGLPTIWTVQAPHCAMQQPNFVPVMPIMSRNTHSSGISGGAMTDTCSPLIVSVVAMSIPSNPAAAFAATAAHAVAHHARSRTPASYDTRHFTLRTDVASRSVDGCDRVRGEPDSFNFARSLPWRPMRTRRRMLRAGPRPHPRSQLFRHRHAEGVQDH